jgi:MscS family membrane protein
MIYLDFLDLHINRYLLAVGIFLFFQFFRVVFRKVILKIVQKTANKNDDAIFETVQKPIDIFFIVIGLKLAKEVLNLTDKFDRFLEHIIQSAFIIIIFWAFLEILSHLAANIHKIQNSFGDKISVSVANFIVKTIRLFLLIFAVIMVLQEWGYNVSGFLASLGLVGMAFALAAKDTAANLFGSLVIFIDKPFDIGDWIKTPEVEGTIKTIGIRSTKVRTFAQALVTVPNATLANSAILNWSRMGKRRIKMNIGITYDTKVEVVQKIVSDIKDMLQNHPDIHQDTIHIYFTNFGASSLDIFCYFFTKTTNWGAFMRVQEDTNFRIMKIVEQNGSSFAYPTQTIYLEKDKVE